MNKRPFSTRPGYVQSIRGLHRLHALFSNNQNETPEADVVRDSLTPLWYELSEIEKERIGGLSEDLYSISDPPEPVLPMNPQAQRNLIEAFEARNIGEWDKALEMLRRWKRHLDPALLSYMRGSVWHAAGDESTAALFFQHASHLEPENGNYRALYLHCLQKSDRESALTLAREILFTEEAPQPAVEAMAADVLFESTRDLADVDALPIVQRVTQRLSQAFERLQNHGDDVSSSLKSAYLGIVSLLGGCHFQLGETQRALKYYNLGLAADPENSSLLMARGVARYGLEAGAAEDFQQAIRQGSAQVVPYFYLSHHHLVSDRFEECRSMCERALNFSASDEVRGCLNEWLAISMFELGFPRDLVRSKFEEATRLAPDNQRIQQNFELFGKTSAQHDWSMPGITSVKAILPFRLPPILPPGDFRVAA